MKKTTRTIGYALALSLVGNLAPLENNFSLSAENSLEQKVLNCSIGTISEQGSYRNSGRKYTKEEILHFIHNIYNCLHSKPEYFSEKFIKEMVKKESSYNHKAIGDERERGLFQIRPETWQEQTKRLYGRELSFDLAFNPKINLEVGISYLFWIEEFSKNSYQNWENLSNKEKRGILMASYNGGASRLYSMQGDIDRMPSGTRNYIKTIEAGMEVND